MADRDTVHLEMDLGTQHIIDWIADYCSRGNYAQNFIPHLPSQFHTMPYSRILLIVQNMAREAYPQAPKQATELLFAAVSYGAFTNAVERQTGRIATIGEVLQLARDMPLMQHGAPDGTTLN